MVLAVAELESGLAVIARTPWCLPTLGWLTSCSTLPASAALLEPRRG